MNNTLKQESSITNKKQEVYVPMLTNRPTPSKVLHCIGNTAISQIQDECFTKNVLVIHLYLLYQLKKAVGLLMS